MKETQDDLTQRHKNTRTHQDPCDTATSGFSPGQVSASHKVLSTVFVDEGIKKLSGVFLYPNSGIEPGFPALQADPYKGRRFLKKLLNKHTAII